jgi:UDP-2,3-diacylglucosamine hydrolase
MSEKTCNPYKILVLSDLHLQLPHNDSRYKSFLDILKKFQKSSIDELFLMGDIFDILIGPYNFWKRLHPDFFNFLKTANDHGKRITWVQGNHDFQIQSLLDEYKINWIEHDAVVERNQLKIYLAHGDLADWTDKLHPLWRKLLTSGFLKWTLNKFSENFAEKYFYPFALKASSASRHVSGSTPRDPHADKTFKNYALKMGELHHASLVLLGHSHLKENSSLSEKIHYLNIGSWLNESLLGMIEINEDKKFETKIFSVEAWLPSGQ